MFGLCHQFSHHGLDDSDIAVEQATGHTGKQGEPDVGCEAHHDHGQHGAEAAQQENRLAADPVRQATPVHAHQGLGQGERRDEEAGVEGGIILLSDLEPLDEGPGIGKDGREGNGLGESNDGCAVEFQSVMANGPRDERACTECVLDFLDTVVMYVPSTKSCPVGNSSGSRGVLCLVRVMASRCGCALTTWTALNRRRLFVKDQVLLLCGCYVVGGRCVCRRRGPRGKCRHVPGGN